jgi:hypothetical protein
MLNIMYAQCSTLCYKVLVRAEGEKIYALKKLLGPHSGYF